MQGLLEPERPPDLRDVLPRRVGARDDGRGVPGRQVDEDERHRGHDEGDRDQGDQAPDDVDPVMLH